MGRAAEPVPEPEPAAKNGDSVDARPSRALEVPLGADLPALPRADEVSAVSLRLAGPVASEPKCTLRVTSPERIRDILAHLGGIDWAQEGVPLTRVQLIAPDIELTIFEKSGVHREYAFYWRETAFIDGVTKRLLEADVSALRMLIIDVLIHHVAAQQADDEARSDDPPDEPGHVLFRESFDDSQLLKRGWYDGDNFAISDAEPHAGKGCIEYAWKADTTTPASSSGVRRLFEPTDTVYLRFFIRLSKNWSWTERGYHPHLMHFMTTENGRYHGPAASHLTLYIEPWNGKLRLAAQDIQNKDQPHGLTQGPLRGGYNG
jgi:hypothetical protein